MTGRTSKALAGIRISSHMLMQPGINPTRHVQSLAACTAHHCRLLPPRTGIPPHLRVKLSKERRHLRTVSQNVHVLILMLPAVQRLALGTEPALREAVHLSSLRHCQLKLLQIKTTACQHMELCTRVQMRLQQAQHCHSLLSLQSSMNLNLCWTWMHQKALQRPCFGAHQHPPNSQQHPLSSSSRLLPALRTLSSRHMRLCSRGAPRENAVLQPQTLLCLVMGTCRTDISPADLLHQNQKYWISS